MGVNLNSVRINGFLLGAFGFFATLFFIIYLNSLQSLKEKRQEKAFREITAVKQPKPPEEQQQKTEKKMDQPKPSQSITPPPPGLSSGLSGVEISLPQFAFEGSLATGDAKDIVGEAKGDIVMTEKSVDQPPVPRSRVAPEYPKAARAKGISGYVALSILVDEDGNVQQVEVLESNPPKVFEDAAVMAVRQWKFEPGKYKGKPVKTWVKQVIKFELQ